MPTAEQYWRQGAAKFPIVKQGELTGAINAFVKSIEAAQNEGIRFARAHGWLSYALVTAVIDGWKIPKINGVKLNEQQALAKAVTEADEAIAVESTDYDNHWVKGFVSLHTGDAAGAEYHFKKAASMNTNRHLLIEHADERVFAGMHSEAEKLIDDAWAKAKNPPHDWHRWVYAWVLYFKAPSQLDPLTVYKKAFTQPGLAGPPAIGKTPAELLLMKAALHGRLSLMGHVGEKKKAENTLKQYLIKRKIKKNDFTEEMIRRFNPFQVSADADHWVEALIEAGAKPTP